MPIIPTIATDACTRPRDAQSYRSIAKTRLKVDNMGVFTCYLGFLKDFQFYLKNKKMPYNRYKRTINE